jgi:hypothetical protein
MSVVNDKSLIPLNAARDNLAVFGDDPNEKLSRAARELGWFWKNVDTANSLQSLLRVEMLVVADQTTPPLELLRMDKRQRPQMLRMALREWGLRALVWQYQRQSKDAYRWAYLEGNNRYSDERQERYRNALLVFLLSCLIQDNNKPLLEPIFEALEEIMPITMVGDQQAIIKRLIKTLPDRTAPWEPEREIMYTLLIDMGCGLTVHGETIDQTAEEVGDPAEALTGYVQMYREYFAECGDIDKARSMDEIAYGAKLAWRIWQQAKRSNTALEKLLEVLWRVET